MSESIALKRILILDDDADFRALLRAHLGKLFDQVELQEYDPVARGAPGEDFDWSRYDVLILDYYLCIHNLTGLDILQANRKNKFFPAAIMLTGAGSEEIAVRAVKAGVYDYLRKEKLDKEQLKRSILNAFEQHKDERQRLSELTNQSLAFNKALFYQELEASRGDSGKDRVLLLIQLDDEQMLEQRLGGILRDNIVRHIARRSFEVFQVGDCHPHITRLGDAAVAMLIDSPESRKTLDFNMNGLCTHLKKRPYKFDDKKFRYTVSIGVVEIPRSGRSADRLIEQARRAAEIAARTEGNSFHFFVPEDEPAAAAAPAATAGPEVSSAAAPEISIDADLVDAIDDIVEEPPEPTPVPLSLQPDNFEPEAPAPAAPVPAPVPAPDLTLEPLEDIPPAKPAAKPSSPVPELSLEPLEEKPAAPSAMPAATPKPPPERVPLAPKPATPAVTRPATKPSAPEPPTPPAPPASAKPAIAPASGKPVPGTAFPPAQPTASPPAPAGREAPKQARPTTPAPVPRPAPAKPASDEIELDNATLSEAARAVRKAFEEKRVVQTFQPVISLFSEEGVEVPEVYRVRLQLIDRDGAVKNEDLIYAEANTPNFQKFIDRWLLRETIGRIVNNPGKDQVFIIRISEPSLADPGLFNWLRKLLSGLDKQRPGKSIALEVSAPEFANQQKKAAALIAYLGKSQGFRFVMAQVHEPDQAQPLVAGQAGIELLKIGTETLQKLKAAPAASGQTGSMFDGIVGKGVEVIAEGVEDATTLTNVISAGAHYAMGNFIGEAVQHLEDSTNVESFEIT